MTSSLKFNLIVTMKSCNFVRHFFLPDVVVMFKEGIQCFIGIISLSLDGVGNFCDICEISWILFHEVIHFIP